VYNSGRGPQHVPGHPVRTLPGRARVRGDLGGRSRRPEPSSVLPIREHPRHGTGPAHQGNTRDVSVQPHPGRARVLLAQTMVNICSGTVEPHLSDHLWV